MKNYKIITWNINQQSKNGKGNIPSLIIEKIKDLNADIICLTEYVKGNSHIEFCNSLLKLGYDIFADPRNENLRNEILIAIKKNLVKETEVNILPFDNMYPNFLHLETKIDDKILHIIGVRVRIGFINSHLSYNKKLPIQIQDSKDRMIQINNLINYIKNLTGNICVIGDFNNHHYLEDQEVNSWEFDKDFLQNYYSYPLLVQSMKNITNLKNYTPTGKLNKVYSWNNQNVSPDNVKRYIRNDHLFTNINVKNIYYSWDFEFKNKVSYPDHAILIATIEF